MRRASALLASFRIALLALAGLVGCGGGWSSRRSPNVSWPPTWTHDAVLVDGRAAAALAFASAQVGKRYCWGGTGPSCFDCSGLVQTAWRHAGIALPRTADAQAKTLMEVSPDQARPGDILWWPGHVGLYLGRGEMVDAVGAAWGVRRRPAKPPERVLRVVP